MNMFRTEGIAANLPGMADWRARARARMRELKLTQEIVAEKLNLTQGTVGHWLAGRREPETLSRFEEFAKLLKFKNLHEMLYGDGQGAYNTRASLAAHGLVPLISWVRAGPLCDAEDRLQPGDAEAWLPCPVPFGEGTYALRVVGNSMEPEYREGEAIYVDPSRAAKHGDDIIVRTPDGRVTFKRFQDTPEGKYLLALNPDHPERIISVPEGTVICGVIIGSWMDRRK